MFPPRRESLPDLELKVFNSGWVETPKGMIAQGEGREKIRVPAMFAMIRHPVRGVMLYDTGYHTRFYEAVSGFPFGVLQKFTPAEIERGHNASVQLEMLGISPGDVKGIILGHGHVDHVAGLKDFPDARVVVDRREWDFMQGNKYRIFRKGYVKSLYEGIPNRVDTVEFGAGRTGGSLFDNAVDLFEDGSLMLAPLEGHTRGQMGLMVNLPDGKSYFFIGDAAWISENYLRRLPPSKPARLILADFQKFRKTLDVLNDFHRAYPWVTMVPSHCPAVWENLCAEGTAVQKGVDDERKL